MFWVIYTHCDAEINPKQMHNLFLLMQHFIIKYSPQEPVVHT